MAKWERFIVYPLLLVALFLSVSNSERVLEATESVADEVRARRIVVVGEKGNNGIVLDTNFLGGGSLSIYDPAGEQEILLDSIGIGGSLSLYNRNGTNVIG